MQNAKIQDPHHQGLALGILKTVCDASPAIRKQMSETYSAVTVTDDIDAALNDVEIKCVAIAALHFDLATRVVSPAKEEMK